MHRYFFTLLGLITFLLAGCGPIQTVSNATISTKTAIPLASTATPTTPVASMPAIYKNTVNVTIPTFSPIATNLTFACGVPIYQIVFVHDSGADNLAIDIAATTNGQPDTYFRFHPDNTSVSPGYSTSPIEFITDNPIKPGDRGVFTFTWHNLVNGKQGNVTGTTTIAWVISSGSC
jgi:hypothetical protein